MHTPHALWGHYRERDGVGGLRQNRRKRAGLRAAQGYRYLQAYFEY